MSLTVKSYRLRSASIARRGMKSLPAGTEVWGVYHKGQNLWFYYAYDTEYAATEVAAKLGIPNRQSLSCNFRDTPPFVVSEYKGY